MKYTDFISEEKRYIVYVDGKPATHHHSRSDAEEYAMIAKDPKDKNQKVEIRFEELPVHKSRDMIGEDADVIKAKCELEHADDGIAGHFLFSQKPGQPTLLVGRVTGLEPGEHGFHIHQYGDLSNGCESAGPHFNPDGVDHGDATEGHVGDLGNITADENGVAEINMILRRVDLSGDRSVVGRAIVVHADEDDLGQGGDEESLKTGNAGDRVGCGVIRLSESLNEIFAYGLDLPANQYGQPDYSKPMEFIGSLVKSGLDRIAVLKQLRDKYEISARSARGLYDLWQRTEGAFA